MKRAAVILRNVASNWTGFAVNALVMFLLTPFVLRELGETRYGIWVLTTSIVGYYGILDLGFRAGVNQFLTRSLAVPDFERASAVLSTAVYALSLLGLAMIGLSVAAAYLAPVIFDLSADIAQEAFWCILIVASTAGVQCALSAYSSIFVATQRFDLANLIGISYRLVTAAGTVAALKLGYGLIGVAVVNGAVNVLDYSTRWLVARKLVPNLRVSLAGASMEQLRNVGSFGLWNFLIAVSRYVYLHVQPLLIVAVLPVSAVAHYALATGLWYQINAVFTPVGQVLYPAAASMDVRGERETLNRLFRDGSRLLLLVVIPVVLIAYVWAEEFYALWIGERFLTGAEYTSVATLLRVLLLGTLLSYSTNIAGQILLACGHIRPLALLQISGAAVNLTMSLVLVGRFGLMGMAIASVLAVILVDVLGIPFALRKLVGIHVKDFLGAAWLKLASVTFTLALSLAALHSLGAADDWASLVLSGIAAATVSGAIVILLGITAEERRLFVQRPLRSAFAKLASRRT